VVESSAKMFTVLPKAVPVPLAYTSEIKPDHPSPIIIVGRNLMDCSIDLGTGTVLHTLRSDDGTISAIVTIPQSSMAAGSIQLSLLDSKGNMAAQYSVSEYSGTNAAGNEIDISLTPVPNQPILGPTEKDNAVFSLNPQSSLNSIFDWSNFAFTIFEITIILPIYNQVSIIPFFDGGDEFESPVIAQVGRLFRLRGMGILVALRIEITIHIRVVIVIGFIYNIWPYGLYNEFPSYSWGLGSIVIDIIIEIEIIFNLSFMLALIEPNGNLRVLIAVNLSVDIDFTIDGDGNLRFDTDFTHRVYIVGISPLNNLQPCGGRFELASDNGQTTFLDNFGGYQSFYFPREAGQCCLGWDFNLELVRFREGQPTETVQSQFQAEYCLTAAPSSTLYKIEITSTPPPVGTPPTLTLDLTQTAELVALAVPVDANGNPTGAPAQDVRDLGYGVQFFLENAPEQVLYPQALLDGHAIAIDDGDNIIHAALTSEPQILDFYPGSVFGFQIIDFLAEGQQPRTVAGGLPVTVSEVATAIKVTPKLAYRDSNGQLQVVANNELIRNEPFEVQQEYVLALEVEITRRARLPQNITVKVDTAEIKVIEGNSTKSKPPLQLPDSDQFSPDRAAAIDPPLFFTGDLAVQNEDDVITLGPTSQGTLLKDFANLKIKPNNKEEHNSGNITKFVPPGEKVVNRSVELWLNLKITSNVNKGITVKESKLKLKVSNEETFEEYLRVFHEVQDLLTDTAVTDPDLRNFAKNFYTNDLKPMTSEPLNSLLITKGKDLWDKSVNFVKNTAKDDRVLYYLRLLSIAALRAHYKRNLSIAVLPDKKLKMFEWSSRGLETTDGVSAKITFPQTTKRKAIITGFDPFQLLNVPDQSNPSGLLAQALDNEPLGDDPDKIMVRTAVIPVRYEDFDKELIEKIAESSLTPIVMFLTTSEHGSDYYDVERFASKRREPNDKDNAYKGYKNYVNALTNGDKYLESTLPYIFAIRSDNYTLLVFEGPTSPATPLVLDQSYWVSGYQPIPAPRKYHARSTFGSSDSYTKLPDDQTPLPGKDLNAGSGGGFLSNEIFYRVALIRNRDRSKLPSGHLHVPPTGTDPRGTGSDLITGSTKAISQLLQYSYLLKSEEKWDVNFPDTGINRSPRIITRTITNTTKSPVKIVSSDLDIQGTITVQLPSALPITIPPESSIQLVYKFLPTAVGDYTGKLTLKDENGEIVFFAALKGKALLNPPPPTIASFSPRSGYPGTSVTITGTDFIDVQNVQLGSHVISHNVDSETQITVEVSAPGGLFKVQTNYGTGTSNLGFIVIPIRNTP
jgi:pyrrolidone-carboxylate peptidase